MNSVTKRQIHTQNCQTKRLIDVSNFLFTVFKANNKDTAKTSIDPANTVD